ncbi:MAG: bifunctional glycosyltransferase family 2/GtrA family protein [Oscillospiraceae bacterium]|jgi:putative flippase GtrA|nr:bifunctional glycosyltransferase family 2/GtrA family protein [Oscillospiraceae bacterium]
METVVLIPAYKPDAKLLGLVADLCCPVIVVDDGSGGDYAAIFTALEQLPRCVVLRHNTNRGKGAALKTGMREALVSGATGLVTADADGQHLPEDILSVKNALDTHPGKLVLGCRDFSQAQCPFKSRAGNIITRRIFQLMTGVPCTDTQTGLRGIPLALLRSFSEIEGDRYDYEMNMLIYAAKRGYGFAEVPIHTIYLDDNKSSHFKPFLDSLRIYGQIIIFTLVSVICSAVDISLFWLFTSSGASLLPSIAAARACSSLINFLLNKNITFRRGNALIPAALRYYTLVVCQMFTSWLLLSLIARINLPYLVLQKAAVDFALFIVGYNMQRMLVFRKRR